MFAARQYKSRSCTASFPQYLPSDWQSRHFAIQIGQRVCQRRALQGTAWHRSTWCDKIHATFKAPVVYTYSEMPNSCTHDHAQLLLTRTLEFKYNLQKGKKEMKGYDNRKPHSPTACDVHARNTCPYRSHTVLDGAAPQYAMHSARQQSCVSWIDAVFEPRSISHVDGPLSISLCETLCNHALLPNLPAQKMQRAGNDGLGSVSAQLQTCSWRHLTLAPISVSLPNRRWTHMEITATL